MNTQVNTPLVVSPPGATVKMEVPATGKNPELRTFYARLDGCQYYFKDGKAARFEGGEYETDKAHEIEELEALCKEPGQYLISTEKLEVKFSDAKILKDVSSSKVAQGPVNSMMLGNIK